MQQRGLKQADADLIMEFGTAVDSGYILKRKDVDTLEHDLRRLLARLHRLAGSYIVSDGDTVITAFRATPAQQRRLIGDH